MDAYCEQQLIDIDVAEACENALVKQNDFHRTLCALQAVMQGFGGDRQSIRAEVVGLGVTGPGPEVSEASRIAEGQGCAVVQCPDDVAVRWKRLGIQPEIAGHAEVDANGVGAGFAICDIMVVRFSDEKEILAMACDLGNSTALQQLCRRDSPASGIRNHITPTDVHSLDDLPDQGGFELTTQCFNFR